MNPDTRWLARAGTLMAAAAILGGCGPAEAVREYFREPTPHEEYVLGLSHAGLSETALGRDWILASQTAIAKPLEMDAPYMEEGFFPSEVPSSLGYRFPLRRGQRLVVRVDLVPAGSLRIFVDLFRSAPDTSRAPVPVLSGEAGTELVYRTPSQRVTISCGSNPNSCEAGGSPSPSKRSRP